MPGRNIMIIVWSAFLAACGLELLVFGLVDPQDVHLPGWSRQSVYTAAFFAFWLLCMVSSAITVLLKVPPAQVDRRPPR